MRISTIIKVTKLGTSLVVSIQHDIFRVAWKLIYLTWRKLVRTQNVSLRDYISDNLRELAVTFFNKKPS